MKPEVPGWYVRDEAPDVETFFNGAYWTDRTREIGAEIPHAPVRGGRPAEASAVGSKLAPGASEALQALGIGAVLLAVIIAWIFWSVRADSQGSAPAQHATDAAAEESRAFGFAAGLALSGEGRARTESACGQYYWKIGNHEQTRAEWRGAGGDPDLVTDFGAFLSGCQSV